MKNFVYLLIILFVFYFFNYLINNIGIENNRYQFELCNTHEKFFKSRMINAIVKIKTLDSTNHMTKTLVINNSGEDVIIFFDIPSDFNKFDLISCGDIICKNANSFKFFILDKDSMSLSYNCKYD